MVGSASAMDSNRLPFSVPGGDAGAGAWGNSCFWNMEWREVFRRLRWGGRLGKLLLLEHGMAGLFAMKRGVIQHCAHFRLVAALRQNAQLLLRAIVLPGEAERSEEDT